MPTAATPITVIVTAADTLNPLIRRFTLRAADGAPLPGHTPGAHLRVRVTRADGVEDWRHYSLINLVPDAAATRAPAEYVIAVRRDDAGRGGSRFMHERVQVGDRLLIEPPHNDFPLGEHAACAVLVAGGIGITPLLGMAAQRRAQGKPVRLHYAGRSRELMAFAAEAGALLGDDLRLHVDSEAGRPFDVATLLGGCGAHDELYVCGPTVLLDAVLAEAAARGWPRERIHFELFTTPVPLAGDRAFEIVLAQGGQTLTVPAGTSILDCLIAHGCDPLFDCRRGECGVCTVPVIEGEIEHRDHVLSDAEKAAGQVMQICVSRARGPRLVLDL